MSSVADITIKRENFVLISEIDTKAFAFKKTRDTCAGNVGKLSLKSKY